MVFDRGGRFTAEVATATVAQRGYHSAREFTEVSNLQRKQILCQARGTGEQEGRQTGKLIVLAVGQTLI